MQKAESAAATHSDSDSLEGQLHMGNLDEVQYTLTTWNIPVEGK